MEDLLMVFLEAKMEDFLMVFLEAKMEDFLTVFLEAKMEDFLMVFLEAKMEDFLTVFLEAKMEDFLMVFLEAKMEDFLMVFLEAKMEDFLTVFLEAKMEDFLMVFLEVKMEDFLVVSLVVQMEDFFLVPLDVEVSWGFSVAFVDAQGAGIVRRRQREGVRMNVGRGNGVLGGPLTLLVSVNITANARLVQDTRGSPRLLVENCKTNLGGIKILSGFLPLSLDNVLSSLLNEVIPGLLCPVVDVVLNLLNTVLGTVNSVCPFGLLGKLHYTLAGLPLFQDQHIVLNLNLMMTDLNGQPVDFPGAQNASLPLLPAKDGTSQLMLPIGLLSSVLQMLVSKGGFNVDLTALALGGSVPMTTSALRSVLPELSPLGTEDLPLVVKIRVSGVPVVSLQNGKAKIMLGAALQILSQSNSSLIPLFTVNANISLSGSFSITRTMLSISLALDSVSVSVSDVGSFDENALTTWVTNILQIGYLPLINVGLNIGIPLPNIFNLNFADGVVKTLEDMVVINNILK
ncbi:BPI fold-containing family B member 3-like [Erythrolamprus reginae]|uniref:BPI fold-containing family B member 3-like n=1 Tax=Erythrolamprus reginae TaxID=121349 RepID=UPI00396D0089